MPIRDITNQTFGRLTVIELCDVRAPNNECVWLCQCTCGNRVKVIGSSIRTGNTKSCGCLRVDMGVIRGTASRKHGDSPHRRSVKNLGTPEYNAWGQMIHRCSNPNSKMWAHYGGRGITVCERWRSYETFLEDMGRKPSPKHSIDRINVNGNYEPSNCRWATYSEQNNNRRTNRYITINGVTHTMSEWLRHYGMTPRCFYYRTKTMGMSEADALTTPIVVHSGRHVTTA